MNSAKPAESKDLVVILHGIGMSPMRMAYTAFRLRRSGYETLNLAYPSLRHTIEESADIVAKKITAKLNGEVRKVHFVCHSMGCLVALHLIAQNTLGVTGRAVFIAPPYHGSEVADFLQQYRLYKYIFGPAGAQLTTAYRKALSYTLPEGVEIGVVAGSRAYEYPFFLSVMKKTGVHDGLVSLESTRIPGTMDHITLRFSHSFLLESAAHQAVHFLMQGRFKHEITKEKSAP